MKLKCLEMIKELHIMAGKSKLAQAVYALIFNNIETEPFAGSFAETTTSASGANGLQRK